MTTTHIGADVGDLIVGAFKLARQRHPALHETWISVSHGVSSLLPHSLLSKSVQRDGDIDLVLRCMEDEFAARPHQHQDQLFLQDHYMVIISEIWIGSIYETIRLLGERRLVESREEYQALAHDLRLLRIPLEKHGNCPRPPPQRTFAYVSDAAKQRPDRFVQI